jgi:hypothetical protein
MTSSELWEPVQLPVDGGDWGPLELSSEIVERTWGSLGIKMNDATQEAWGRLETPARAEGEVVDNEDEK